MMYTTPDHTLDRPVFLQFPADILLAGYLQLSTSGTAAKRSWYPRALSGNRQPLRCRNIALYKPLRSRFPARLTHVEETDGWIILPRGILRDRELAPIKHFTWLIAGQVR